VTIFHLRLPGLFRCPAKSIQINGFAFDRKIFGLGQDFVPLEDPNARMENAQ
jgi:hypothetical protein